MLDDMRIKLIYSFKYKSRAIQLFIPSIVCNFVHIPIVILKKEKKYQKKLCQEQNIKKL